MKKLLLSGFVFLLLYGGSNSAMAQKTDYSKADVAKYMNTITAEDLKKHLYIVASDEMEGRNTGSEGQKKAGRYLIEQYQKNDISFPKIADGFYQKVPAEYMSKGFSPKLNDSENIWAFIEGSEKPEEILVISAHYDHVGMKNGEVYNGADDDGSGTVALLEIAQAFMIAKKDGYGPKRSILFLHVTGEEYGLHGSRYYSDNPLFPIENTIADINIDMIGRRDADHKDTNNYVYVIGSDRLSTDLHNINEEANKKYVNLDLDYKYNDLNDPNRFYYRSDHYNFAKKGIPSIFYFNGVHEDYHRAGDEPHKIEYDALAKRTQLAFVTAWELANRPNRPRVDKDGK
jgi:hypothetical protein